MALMDQYDLKTDPCEYRMIRISNCIQMISCIIDIMAIFDNSLREVSRIIDIIADVVYHTISGCMTAQVAIELDYRYGPNYIERPKKMEDGKGKDGVDDILIVIAEPCNDSIGENNDNRNNDSIVENNDNKSNDSIKKTKRDKKKKKMNK